MKPVRASFPVSSISRCRPTSSRISSHSAPVRWSFHRIAGRSGSSELSSRTAPCICPARPTAATSAPGTLDVARTDRMAARAAVPPHGRMLLAPQRARHVEAIRRRADAGDAARLVDEHCLRRGRRDVDPEDVCHEPQRSRSTAQIRWLTRLSIRSCPPDRGWGSMPPSATRASRSASEAPPMISAPMPSAHPS